MGKKNLYEIVKTGTPIIDPKFTELYQYAEKIKVAINEKSNGLLFQV